MRRVEASLLLIGTELISASDPDVANGYLSPSNGRQVVDQIDAVYDVLFKGEGEQDESD